MTPTKRFCIFISILLIDGCKPVEISQFVIIPVSFQIGWKNNKKTNMFKKHQSFNMFYTSLGSLWLGGQTCSAVFFMQAVGLTFQAPLSESVKPLPISSLWSPMQRGITRLKLRSCGTKPNSCCMQLLGWGKKPQLGMGPSPQDPTLSLTMCDLQKRVLAVSEIGIHLKLNLNCQCDKYKTSCLIHIIAAGHSSFLWICWTSRVRYRTRLSWWYMTMTGCGWKSLDGTCENNKP